MNAAATAVKDIDQIRKENARTLAQHSGSLTAFADQIDRAPTQVSRFLGKNATKVIGNKMARHIESMCGYDHGWLDQDHSAQAEQPTPEQVAESSPPTHLLQRTVQNRSDILLLRDIITAIEEIIREEREELTPAQKAHAITACLEAALKQPEAERAPRAIAHTAIRAVI